MYTNDNSRYVGSKYNYLGEICIFTMELDNLNDTKKHTHTFHYNYLSFHLTFHCDQYSHWPILNFPLNKTKIFTFFPQTFNNHLFPMFAVNNKNNNTLYWQYSFSWLTVRTESVIIAGTTLKRQNAGRLL